MPRAPEGPVSHSRLVVIVRGRVQGVGFRWFTRRVARAEALAGWVANQPDGSVRVVAEGPADGLERLTQALRRGPQGARVEGLEITPAPGSGDLPHPFQIK